MPSSGQLKLAVGVAANYTLFPICFCSEGVGVYLQNSNSTKSNKLNMLDGLSLAQLSLSLFTNFIWSISSCITTIPGGWLGGGGWGWVEIIKIKANSVWLD